jgi:hypothetical protein
VSGRKQHYIPQSLLRGFGRQGKGKAVQVTVYTKDQGVFTTSTGGVAAKRYFYSELAANTDVENLDNKITAYETKLAKVLAEFRATAPGGAVGAAKAAEAVTHLCVRQAHLRNSFASGAGQLISAMGDLFGDKERTRKLMGIDAQTPDKIFQGEIDKSYEQWRPQLSQAGFTKHKFQQLAFAKMKSEFESDFPNYSSLFQSVIDQLQGQTEKMARQGQIRALGRSLAPESRIKYLKQLAWRIEAGSTCGFVLPDCVAISWSAEEGYQPFVYSGKGAAAVFMPLSHDRLLVGELGEAIGSAPELTNKISAACSWDCFIARDRNPELEQLAPGIGELTRELIQKAVASAFEEYR